MKKIFVICATAVTIASVSAFTAKPAVMTSKNLHNVYVDTTPTGTGTDTAMYNNNNNNNNNSNTMSNNTMQTNSNDSMNSKHRKNWNKNNRTMGKDTSGTLPPKK